MSSKPLLNYEDNKEQARSSLENDREALVVPVLEGKEVSLLYHRGKLTNGGDYKVPKRLYTEAYPNWGGFRIKDIEVCCKVIGKQLVAVDVTFPKGTYHPLMQNLALLKERGFKTQLIFSGWMDFRPCKDSKAMERLLEKRLELVNQVISGDRTSLWDSRSQNHGGPTYAFTKATPVKNLRVLDCIGFIPTAKSKRVQAVYKVR